MTTHANGMTAGDDASRKAAGGTGASGDIVSFQAEPGTMDGFDMGVRRRRESLEIDIESTSSADVIEHARPGSMNRDMVLMIDAAAEPNPWADDDQPDTARMEFDDHRTDGSALVSDPTPQQRSAFEVIRRVRKLIGVKDTQEKTTHDQYTTIARRLERKLGHPLDKPDSTGCRDLLDSYAARAVTFRLYKTAVLWFLRQELRRALAEQDQMQRSGQRDDSWIARVRTLGESATEYQKIKNHKRVRPVYVEGMLEPEDKSKRRDLLIIKKRYRNWDQLMLDGAIEHSSYADVVRAMKLAGPRPIEFTYGVIVALEMTGEASITIKGGKVDEVRGQPWRKIFFPVVDLPYEWQCRLQLMGDFFVSVHSEDALRSALTRISGQVIPGVPAATAYAFRHAIATRLRRQGFSSTEIGAFLGHTAAETQRVYGFKSARIKGGRKLRETSSIRIDVPREVRSKGKSGLTRVLDSQPPKVARSRQP